MGLGEGDLDLNSPSLLKSLERAHPRAGGWGGEARPSQKPTVIRSMPGLEVPELESETCQNLQKAGLQ